MSFIHFIFFYVPLYFSIPRRILWFFCVCVWFIPFNFIIFFLPFFHLISSRTNSSSSHLESPPPRSVVPHFVCLHFIINSGKSNFHNSTSKWKQLSLLFQAVYYSRLCMSGHLQELHAYPLCRTRTYTCSRPRTANINALPLLLCRSFIMLCHRLFF